jgi:hypothetical protein
MLAAVGVTGAGSAYKALGLRGERHDPATHAVVLGLACLASSSLLFTPTFYRFIDSQLGIVNLCELLGHACALAAGWQGQRLLLHLTGTATAQRVRWRGCVAAGAIAGLVVCFAVGPRPVETIDFTVLITGQWANTCYWLALTCCVMFQLADIARLAWGCARLASREWIGLGLGIVTLGCGIGIAAFVDPLTYVVVRLAGSSPPRVLDAVGHVLCVTSLCLVAVGATMPAWSKSLARDPSAFVRAYRDCRQLRPLWTVLREAVPGIALNQPARNVEFRLYRRVIEIRDGILSMRADVDNATRLAVSRCARERGLDGADVDAAVEAAAIHRAVTEPCAVPTELSATQEVIGGSSLDEEVAWLRRVANGYAHIADQRCATCRPGLSS